MSLNVFKWQKNALYTKWDKQASSKWCQMFADTENVKWRASQDPNYCKAHVFYACDQRNTTIGSLAQSSLNENMVPT